MKLEKTKLDMSMFEKKTITLKDFKEKLINYKNINDKFIFWEYEENNGQLKNKSVNYSILFFLSSIPSTILTFMLMKYIGIYSLLVVLLGNFGVGFFLRNLRFGILKNSYQKWQILRKDIKNILSDKDNIFSLLMETELNLQNLKKSILPSEDLNLQINQSIKNVIEEMKEDFSNYQDEPDNILKLLDKIEKVENYKENILKNIKVYQLNSDYIEYKKTHGLIENNNEREILEDKMVKKFKAIL